MKQFAALRGKPDAGNPHVRFDEGEVALAATPRLGAPLYKKIACLAVAGLSLAVFADNRANPDAIELMPLPAPVKFTSDMDHPVAFDATATVEVICPDVAAADWLGRHFAEWYGVHAPKVAAARSSATGGDEDTQERVPPGDEAYTISAASAGGIRIAANTIAGVRWAAYTLRQLAIAKRGTFRTEGRLLPTLKITDYPHLAFRAVHLCWFPEIRPQQMERAIRLAALLKFNHAIIEPWGMYASEKHPWWHWPDPTMTKDEVRRLVAIGRDLGITLIPQINAYGHATSSRTCTIKHSALDLQPEYEPLFEPGGWNWCLSNPETQRVLRELIVELLGDFGNPPYIHLGCDEAQPPTCPECRKRPYGDLVCEHISGLTAVAREHGAKAMVWHDMLLNRHDPRWKGYVAFGSKITATLADTLPKDVVVCDWQYGNMKDKDKDWPTMAYFKEKGFPVAGCPFDNYNAMRPMADFLAKIGGFGYIQTTWHHLRGADWTKMYRYGASAAWGTDVRGKGSHGATPLFDTEFAIPLRLVGHDMKVTNYLDTGRLNHQVPPSWWGY